MTSIAVFFLGGTISMAGHAGGVVSRLSGDELVAAVPQLDAVGVDLDVRDFRRISSACLRFDDILELVAAAEQVRADGVVVVQGTDTIEETSYLIDLLWTSDSPVVMTGAMRNPTLAGPDGSANLLAAVQVAANPAFQGAGCVVVLNDQVHAARYVRKTHTTNPGTFASPNAGPLAQLAEGDPLLGWPLPRRFTVPRPAAVNARVPVVTVTLDDGGELLAGLDVDGLVVAAFGGGHVPDTMAPVLGDLAARMPVVLASRTGGGAMLRRTYGFIGSETDLAQRGLIGAGRLDPYKARVLLRVLLAGGASRDEIVAAFG